MLNVAISSLNLGSWKSSLLKELINLEDNLNQLYIIAGLNTSSVLSRNNKEDGGDEYLKPYERLDDSSQDFENIINDHLLKTKVAACNICSLISVRTEFDLPIPLFVLLKLSAKVGLIRWKDFKKRPNGLLKNYVYSLTPDLIETNLMLFRSIITILGTNIIPFISFINQTTLRILDWTRSSNLLKHDEKMYHIARSKSFEVISLITEQLSLNLNLDPQQLKVLLTCELVDKLEELFVRPTTCALFRDKHVVEALRCSENLLIVYTDLLDATLESKLKSHVIQTCLGIYRDFSANTLSQMCRKQLLQLLQTIANQPYATSTTEISYHILELAEKFESDPEMRTLIRRSLKIGLAHRPTIVTNHDVYNCYGRPMLSSQDDDTTKNNVALDYVSPDNVSQEDVSREAAAQDDVTQEVVAQVVVAQEVVAQEVVAQGVVAQKDVAREDVVQKDVAQTLNFDSIVDKLMESFKG